jgi:hypothetical protein
VAVCEFEDGHDQQAEQYGEQWKSDQRLPAGRPGRT